jgi:hypothetical protein
MPEPIALFAAIILLLPMGYFLLQAPAFLLVKLENPTVTRLLRGMFNIYFVALTVAGAVGALAFGTAGHRALAGIVAAAFVLAILARRWFLLNLDAAIGACNTGDPSAPGRLRRLHWGGMLWNAILFAALVAEIPHLNAAQ